VRRSLRETRDWHFGVGRRNPQFDCDDQLLPSVRFRGGRRCRSGQCFLHGSPALVAGTFGGTHRAGILAAKAGDAVLRPRSEDWAGVALGFGGRRARNDFVPTRDRDIHRGSIRKMKKKALIVVGMAALILVLAAAYLWGPGAAPLSQPSVVTLSQESFAEFAKAFDAEADVPRVVFLLSPT